MGGPSVGFGPGLAAGVGSAMMRAVTTRGFNRMKACRHGDMLFNVNDRHIGRSLDLYGEWAEAELELLGLFIKPGDTVVDVGANLGTHCLFFAQRVGSGGTVFAFEPQRIVPDIAYGAPGNYGGVGLTGGEEGARGAGGERVPVMTLDQLALERCRLLKIDVEGMELQVLEGGRALIEATRPIVYVENNDVSRSPALIGWLLDREYHLFWHVSRFFNPRNFLNNPDDVFANLADLNMIGVSADLASAFGRFPRVTGRDDNWQALQQRLR
jgi:hypothetical protein